MTDAIRGFARGGNGRGRGGMETKLEAVRIANEAGRPAVIANGRTPGILDSLRRQDRRHAVLPRETPVSAAIRALAEAAKQAARRIASDFRRAAQSGARSRRARPRTQPLREILAANAAGHCAKRKPRFARGELSRALVDRLKLSAAQACSP